MLKIKDIVLSLVILLASAAIFFALSTEENKTYMLSRVQALKNTLIKPATSSIAARPLSTMSQAKIVHRPNSTRGHADHGWLNTYHSFSFANWYDPRYEEFGSLRVLNEDRVAPQTGFPTHPHRDFEIFSYIVSGELTHRDSIKGKGGSSASKDDFYVMVSWTFLDAVNCVVTNGITRNVAMSSLPLVAQALLTLNRMRMPTSGSTSFRSGSSPGQEVCYSARCQHDIQTNKRRIATYLPHINIL